MCFSSLQVCVISREFLALEVADQIRDLQDLSTRKRGLKPPVICMYDYDVLCIGMHIYIYILCQLCLLNVECDIHIIYMVYKRDSVSRHVFDRHISQIGVRLFPPKNDATIRLDDPTRPQYFCSFSELTLPETNSSPPKMRPKHKKETGVSNHHFAGNMFVFVDVTFQIFTRLLKNLNSRISKKLPFQKML